MLLDNTRYFHDLRQPSKAPSRPQQSTGNHEEASQRNAGIGTGGMHSPSGHAMSAPAQEPATPAVGTAPAPEALRGDADHGPKIRRWLPRPRGPVYRIMKFK